MSILDIIKDRGLNVRAVAKVAGVSRPTVYALGDPDYRPSSQVVSAVAAAIGCKVSDIRPELKDQEAS